MKVFIILLSATLAYAATKHGYKGAFVQPQCYDKKNRQCNKVPKQQDQQVCHEEFDVVVDITYIEECECIVTTYCQEQHQEVSVSSQVISQDSQVIDVQQGVYPNDNLGYQKRDTDAGVQMVSPGPVCHDEKNQQCHKIPKEAPRKVPKQICETVVDTTYVEECEDIITTHCDEVTLQVQHSSSIVGQESHLVIGGDSLGLESQNYKTQLGQVDGDQAEGGPLIEEQAHTVPEPIKGNLGDIGKSNGAQVYETQIYGSEVAGGQSHGRQTFGSQINVGKPIENNIFSTQVYGSQAYRGQVNSGQVYEVQGYGNQSNEDKVYKIQVYGAQVYGGQVNSGHVHAAQYGDQHYETQLYRTQVYGSHVNTPQVYGTQGYGIQGHVGY